MPKISRAQRLAQIADAAHAEATTVGTLEVVHSMYRHIMDVAAALAACGRYEVTMELVYPDNVKTPKEITSINRKLTDQLVDDGFLKPLVFGRVKEGVQKYELNFTFKD